MMDIQERLYEGLYVEPICDPNVGYPPIYKLRLENKGGAPLNCIGVVFFTETRLYHNLRK